MSKLPENELHSRLSEGLSTNCIAGVAFQEVLLPVTVRDSFDLSFVSIPSKSYYESVKVSFTTMERFFFIFVHWTASNYDSIKSRGNVPKMTRLGYALAKLSMFLLATVRLRHCLIKGSWNLCFYVYFAGNICTISIINHDWSVPVD